MKFHPIANMFPMLSQDDLDALAADIKEHGLNDSIWLFEDKVLDGRNRAKACELAGVKIKSRDFKGTYSEAVSFVWSENFHRRHLTSSQAGMAVAERKKLDPDFMRVVVEPLKEEAQERMTTGGSRGGKTAGRGRKKAGNSPEKKVSQGKRAPQTRAKLAKMHGTNATTVAACEKILEEHPEQAEAIKSGQQTVSAVVRNIKRQENIAKLESISTKKVKELEGVYDVIVIDPPWPMEKIERDCRPNQSKSLDYPTMTVEAIKAMKMPYATDCHLWLWTTNRFLPIAFDVLESWGLKYVCCFTWKKPGGFQTVGLPQYNSEHILYARRGAPQFTSTKQLFTCFDAPRGKHSEKPEEFYDMVRRVTAGRRVDMFSRREIKDFDRWGQEA